MATARQVTFNQVAAFLAVFQHQLSPLTLAHLPFLRLD
jgi:hypothetical protein